jgi:hypothetical protein
MGLLHGVPSRVCKSPTSNLLCLWGPHCVELVAQELISQLSNHHIISDPQLASALLLLM